jgi:multidrug transporter EmrE-like cation transporter
MAWLYLILAGVCEISWPLGLKLGWKGEDPRPLRIVFAIVAMTASGALLLWAQRFIPMGTAQAAWIGIRRSARSPSGPSCSKIWHRLREWCRFAFIVAAIVDLSIP